MTAMELVEKAQLTERPRMKAGDTVTILTPGGGQLTDGHGHHPYVTTAGSAPTLGKQLLLAYLPPEEATIGNKLAVSYMEELYPVTIESVDATPVLDPDNERIR